MLFSIGLQVRPQEKDRRNPEKDSVYSMHHLEIRGQQIRRGSGISGGVEGDEAFARHDIHRCRRLAIVGWVCGSVRCVPKGQPTVAEPLRARREAWRILRKRSNPLKRIRDKGATS